MKSKPPWRCWLPSLGVIKTHSPPHASNDNPFSEAPLQNAQVLSPVSGVVRIARGRAGLRAGVPSPRKSGAPPQRTGIPDARRRAFRPGRHGLGAGAAGCSPAYATYPERFVKGRPPTPRGSADRRVITRAAFPKRLPHSALMMIVRHHDFNYFDFRCLNVLDSFRLTQISAAPASAERPYGSHCLEHRMIRLR